MSNDVYGFVDFKEKPDSINAVVAQLEQESLLGITQISDKDLYNFPPNVYPSTESLSFVIGDYPGKHNATYLVDYVDYAPETSIGLPRLKRDRLDLLFRFIELLFKKYHAAKVAIAITDSSEISAVRHAAIDDIRELITRDFEEVAPPCCLYIIAPE